MYEKPKLKEPLVANEAGSINSNDPAATESSEYTKRNFLYKFSFSDQTYYSMRPLDNIHIYLWIIKDFAWSQDWYYPALIFGVLSLAWCMVLFYESFRMKSLYEAYMTVATTLWLAGSIVWMTGEFKACFCDEYPLLCCFMSVAEHDLLTRMQ